MEHLSLDTLQIPANGQVFALKKELNKAAVEAAFAAASEMASGRTLGKTIREKRAANGTDFWASFICFRLTRRPPFLPHTELEESTYGFLLFLELQVNAEWFVGIFKHDAASLAEWLDARARPLHRGRFTNAFSGDATVRKMSLQRMSGSKHELQKATYEASDLQSSLPMMAAGRCAIRSIRFQDNAIGSIAVTVNTSRVQRSGGRCPIGDLAALVTMVAKQTQADKHHAFLATFAQAVAIGDLPAGTQPTSVLFDWSGIVEADSLELYRKPPAGQELDDQLSKKVLLRILGDTLPVVADGNGWQFGRIPNRPRGKFSLTSTTYSVKTILGNQVVVKDVNSDETMPLAKWARDNDAYSITFSQPEYFFSGGALYQRADFAHEVDVVRRCLRAEVPLGAASSEKGKPKKTAVQFPPECIFRIAEDSVYANRAWLCCTDLGDEWADYLCIRGNALLFIHCKGGKQTTGASGFQEVVGQALKNLGRIQSTPLAFQEKLSATKKKKYWSRTKIERLRDAGRAWSDFETALGALLANPDATKEVHIVVTMLSKTTFESAAIAQTPHFIQLVWLLASFINSCREMGARPVIVCTI